MFCRSMTAAFFLCLPLPAQVFPTGDPVKPAGGGMVHPLTPAEYRKFIAAVEGRGNFRPVRQLPSGLSPDYRLGYNLVYADANHGWILDRDSDGYKLYLDLDDSGDLTHSEPLRFQDRDGIPRVEVPMKDSVARWITWFELVPDSSDPGGFLVRINSFSRRLGKIVLDGRQIPFRLGGAQGRYGGPGTYVSFDREGNGNYESYRSTDRWVNLAGKTYEFHIDPEGASLTLKESGSRPDRPSLENGSPIPDVSLTGLDSQPHAFRRNSADFVLLEFWNTNCGPCREEMPRLKELYDALPRSRFDILGVTSDESEDVLKKYLAEFSIAWPECREPDDGPVHRLLRIEGIPAYFLLSKDGEILDHWVGSGPTISKIKALLH